MKIFRRTCLFASSSFRSNLLRCTPAEGEVYRHLPQTAKERRSDSRGLSTSSFSFQSALAERCPVFRPSDLSRGSVSSSVERNLLRRHSPCLSLYSEGTSFSRLAFCPFASQSTSPARSPPSLSSFGPLRTTKEEDRGTEEKGKAKSFPSFDFARVYSPPSSSSASLSSSSPIDRTASPPSSSSSSSLATHGKEAASLSSSSSSSALRLEKKLPVNREREEATDGKQQEEAKSVKKARHAKKKIFSASSLPPLLTVTPAASRRIGEIVELYNREQQRKTQQKARKTRQINSPLNHAGGTQRSAGEERSRGTDEDFLEEEEEEAQQDEGSRRQSKQGQANAEEEEEKEAIGIRIGLEKRGCSGLSYTIDVVTAPRNATGALSSFSSSSLSGEQKKQKTKGWRDEEKIETPGGLVFIASDAVMFLVGTEIDFVDTELERKFVFRNPNEKHSCGCGKSFMT